MIYVCPVCKKGFETKESTVKHYLACWKENNPNHTSKGASHSEDIVTRQINPDILNFFQSFQKENK